MNKATVRLIGAVVVGSDSRTAADVLAQFDRTTQADIRDAARDFAEAIDVSRWKKVMSADVVAELHQEIVASDSSIVDFARYKSTTSTQVDRVLLGEKSIQSLDRILAQTNAAEVRG